MSELAGGLRERVAVLVRSGERDALGGATGDWVAEIETWAAVALAGSGPAVVGDALDAAPLWRVTMRTRALAVGSRIGWRGRVLEILAVEEDPRVPDRVVAVAREVRA